MTKTLDLLIRDGEGPDSGLSVPLQALWWLRKGNFKIGPEWDKAHGLCQQDEGDRDHDLVHSLAHWVEGDTANAAYWYRKVGDARAESLAEEWLRVARLLAPAS